MKAFNRFYPLWRSVPALDFDEYDLIRANETRRLCLPLGRHGHAPKRIKTSHRNVPASFRSWSFRIAIEFGRAFYRCPHLEDLRICSVRFSNSGAVATGDEVRESHKLVRADVSNIEYIVRFKWICNVEFPRIKEMYPYVNTFGNLTCLELITQIHNWNW
ncbi:hypothetical protein VNO77_19837 [Canavalia gladiata]|uniref:Uncharacterized protein n=1 Tax=Canavalia gladiata TaxID=3824 RepID=A0AAN9QKS4_CANGL